MSLKEATCYCKYFLVRCQSLTRDGGLPIQSGIFGAGQLLGQDHCSFMREVGILVPWVFGTEIKEQSSDGISVSPACFS